MAKSYYTILGIPSNASLDEIKSAYRNLAKAYHPDRKSGDSGKFKEIHEAYSVLKDTEKRRRYERQRRQERPQRVRVNRVDPATRRQSAAGGPEPLIPQQQQRFHSHRQQPGSRFSSFEDAPMDDMVEWILRAFF